MGTIQDMINRFKKLQDELENLSGKTVSIIPDAKGMIDRQCPKDDCKSHFKVKGEDLKNLFKDEEVFCPFCRNKSNSSDYIPIAQRKQVKDNLQRAINNTIHYGHSISENLGSIQTTEEFELNIQCEKCNARFSVIGAAYFCPCCGFNSIETNAQNVIEKLVHKTENIEVIKKALEQSFTKDEAAIITKSIIENSLTDCIATLQTFSETKYNQLSAKAAPFNAFQNVEKANNLWLSLTGQGYDNWLSKSDIADLLKYTQRRHLIEHKGSIIDTKYLEITSDSNYSVGDRVIVNSTDITSLGKIILKIIERIKVLS